MRVSSSLTSSLFSPYSHILRGTLGVKKGLDLLGLKAGRVKRTGFGATKLRRIGHLSPISINFPLLVLS
jgi:hypothetical protein